MRKAGFLYVLLESGFPLWFISAAISGRSCIENLWRETLFTKTIKAWFSRRFWVILRLSIMRSQILYWFIVVIVAKVILKVSRKNLFMQKRKKKGRKENKKC